jgi:hypothetical protein
VDVYSIKVVETRTNVPLQNSQRRTPKSLIPLAHFGSLAGGLLKSGGRAYAQAARQFADAQPAQGT